MSLNVSRFSFLGGRGGSPVKRKLISFFFIDIELCAQSLSLHRRSMYLELASKLALIKSQKVLLNLVQRV